MRGTLAPEEGTPGTGAPAPATRSSASRNPASAPAPGGRGGNAGSPIARELLLQTIRRHQSGDLDGAIRGYREALATAPSQFDALRLLGIALRASGRPEEAIEAFDRALRVRTDFAEVWGQRGEALAQVGRLTESLESFERAVGLKPDQPSYWLGVGLRRFALRDFGRSCEALRHACELAPDWAAAWSAAGNSLAAARRPAQALEAFDRALAIEPENAANWSARAKALADLGRDEEAIESLARNQALDGESAESILSRVEPLRALRRWDEVLEACNRAIVLAPRLETAYGMRGALHSDLGRLDEALADFERVLELNPRDGYVRLSRGMLHLSRGEWKAGWEDFEARAPYLHVSGLQDEVRSWDGRESIEGRTIVLHCEQGLGDTLLFCRFAPDLAERGARVFLTVPAPLASVCASLDSGVEVLAHGDPMPPHDLQCLLMSLGRLLALDEETIGRRVPYLFASKARREAWQARLDERSWEARPRLRIGIVCSGAVGNENDVFRTIALERLAPVIAATWAQGAEWHLLQKEVREGDEPWLAHLHIVDHRAELHDFADTAGLLSCLDLLVSVDTSVAHLAGAMGVPMILMLSSNADWRYLLGREDSPWYPGALLARQGLLGDWGPVVQRVGREIRGWLERAQSLNPRPSPGGRGEENLVRSAVGRVERAAWRHKAGDRAGAMAQYRSVLEDVPGQFDALRLLAGALLQEGDAEGALPLLARALALRSDSGEVWEMQASALEQAGRYEEALESATQSVEREPGRAGAWDRQGHLLKLLGRSREAVACHERALALDPADAHKQFNLALVRLASGDFVRGWEEYESRLRVPEMRLTPIVDRPLWDGRQSLAGKTILVSSEQGLGDTLQFCRFLPELAGRGARVVLGVPPALQALLEGIEGAERVITVGEAIPRIDCFCWLMSLGRILAIDPAAMAPRVPYLRAPAGRIEAWRGVLGAPDGRRRIGIAFSGYLGARANVHRSIATRQIEEFVSRLAAAGVEWHLVQNEVRAGDEAWLERSGIVDHRARLRDFADTAALLAGLEAVVSIDTSVAHLAGAMGQPLHILLPRNADWRWGSEGERTPWYPTARLVRQGKIGAWGGVLEEVEAQLR